MTEKMVSLRKFLMPELVFGNGSRHLAGQYCKNFNVQKVLMVTDNIVKEKQFFKDVLKSLDESSIKYAIFSDVSPNPRDFEVMRGVEIYKRYNCDSIVSVGGGSPMDCAKGIGIVALNGKHILDYEGINKIDVPLPPLIFIPTTAGTSSDVSQFSIVVNSAERVKIAIISKIIIPDISLLDSETTITMNPYLTACTGMDALTHAIEAYVSTVSSPITDLHALKAIEMVNTYLPEVSSNPTNLELREKVMFASMEAGLAFSNAILGAVHAMAHSLGGYLDLAHGECNSILLEHVINYNFARSADKFREIAKVLGIPVKGLKDREVRNKLFNHIQNFRKNVGITNSLKSIGVNQADIPILAKKASTDACILTNPRKATKRDLEVIYEEAF